MSRRYKPEIREALDGLNEHTDLAKDQTAQLQRSLSELSGPVNLSDPSIQSTELSRRAEHKRDEALSKAHEALAVDSIH